MSVTAWTLEIESPTIGAVMAVVAESGIPDSSGCTPQVFEGGRLGYTISATGDNSPPDWMVQLCGYLEDRGYRAWTSR
jgi:hypothetical protein